MDGSMYGLMDGWMDGWVECDKSVKLSLGKLRLF